MSIMEQEHLHGDQKNPDYNFHLPKFITYPFQVGVISLIFGSFLYFILKEHPVLAGVCAGISILAGGAYVGIFFFIRWFTGLERRLKDREKLLDMFPFRGDEIILDVGCGNGILILNAAKRLTTGQAIGIDIWTKSSGDGWPDAFFKNAEIEGVADRVSLENEDVRKLPYDNESFDIILAGLTMHHISPGPNTEKALSEVTRVLKAGGRLVIYDEPFTIFYFTKLMRKNGFDIEYKDRDMVFGIKQDPAN
jgi:arsenite methyltransferase